MADSWNLEMGASFEADAGRILVTRADGSVMLDTNHKMPAQIGQASLTGQTLVCTNPNAFLQQSGSQYRWHQAESNHVVDHDLGVSAGGVPADWITASVRITHIDADWWNDDHFGDPYPGDSAPQKQYRGGFTAWYNVVFSRQCTVTRWAPWHGSLWAGYIYTGGTLLGNRSLTLVIGANGNWHIRQRDSLRAYNSSYSTPGGLVFGWGSLDITYTFDLKMSWGVVDG